MAKTPDISHIEGGVDWVTATTKSDIVGLAWYDLVYRYSKQLRQDTGDWPLIKDKRKMMYSGKEVGSLFWGKSENQGYIVMCWGDASNQFWTHICPTAKNVSRLDLCVTVAYDKPYLGVVARHYARVGKGLNKQRQYAIVMNSRGGQTLYVGSRKSAQFGRVYDKSAQMGESPGYRYRYEVELKDGANSEMARIMYKRWADNGPVYRDIAEYVHRWFKVRGVSPVFDLSVKNRIEIAAETRVWAADRTLGWLRTQVSPSVQRLIELGYGRQVVEALGLERERLPDQSQLPFWDLTKGEQNGNMASDLT